MAISPTCNNCGEELTEFGAVLLSPPNSKSEVKKFHLCVNCYKNIVRKFRLKL